MFLTASTQQALQLEDKVQACRSRLEKTDSHVTRTERAILLKNLLDALVTSYQATHFLGTLEETISICEEIIDIQQKHHQSHSGSISDLGKSLYSLCRFHGSDMSQRTRCLELLREALRLRPTGHPLRDQALVDYARALQHIGFRQGLGSLNLLEEGITCSREALKLRPPGHPDHDEALSTLANGLGMKFEHCGGLGLLSDVIDTRRHILERCPPGHRERSSALNNLAVELRVRFEYQGGFETLAEAITHWREALQLHPVIQPPEFLTILIRNNLALALTRIFTHCGRSDSLPEAILLRREALQLLPEAHADRGRCIANLAESLLGVFRVRGSVDALTEAIALLRTALDAQPHGHPYRDYTLNILANALQAQFNHQPDVAVLFEAVSLLREALVISPHGHGWRIFLLHTLADLLSRSELGLWSEAITLYREALQICPAGFPDRSQILSGMGRCLLHWKRSSSHVSEGLLRLSEGYADSFSHVSRRLQNSLGDLKAVEKACDAIGADVDLPSWAHLTSQVLGIYAQVIGLLPRAANFGLDHRTRLQAIVGLDEIARNAAARALTLGRVSQAVEMLEEGRGVFWSQTLCLRATEFDGVPDVERKKLEELLHLLEHKARNAESLIPTTVESRERELEICRCLNEETEALVSKIRTYPDLSRFLLPPAFEGLFSRLPDGYVVILNAAHLGYYALLLHRPANLAVSLKLEAPRRRLESDTIRQHVDRATRAYEAKCHDWTAPRATNISNQRSDSFEDVLSLLWTAIVHPVVKELRLQRAAGRMRPRLWWCLTGELGFLPIHAAGVYHGASRACTADYVVSSSTPTLTALAKARGQWTPIPCSEATGILIAEASPPGFSYLPKVAEEVRLVRGCFESAGAKVLNSLLAHTSLSELQSLLESTPAHILHLACHGVQERDPLKSAFMLHGGRLSIEEIMQLNIPSAVLAFLSACQTAKGDRSAPDQAVHLASSMLFCGFRSVVGTMWSMCDADGPKLARDVYSNLLKNGRLDLDDIPYALDEAVQNLRREGVDALRWALFIHIGA